MLASSCRSKSSLFFKRICLCMPLLGQTLTVRSWPSSALANRRSPWASERRYIETSDQDELLKLARVVTTAMGIDSRGELA